MLIGYTRLSTGEHSLCLQRDKLERAGCERVYEDVCSGRATERPGLNKALEVARDGDALVVWKLDRIGRSPKGWRRLWSWALVLNYLAGIRPPPFKLAHLSATDLNFDVFRRICLSVVKTFGADRGGTFWCTDAVERVIMRERCASYMRGNIGL